VHGEIDSDRRAEQEADQGLVAVPVPPLVGEEGHDRDRHQETGEGEDGPEGEVHVGAGQQGSHGWREE